MSSSSLCWADAMRSTATSNLFKELASQKECPACVAITSPDRVRRERGLSYLLGVFAPKGYHPLTFNFADARGGPQAFLNDLGEPSLFEPTKFAVMKALEVAKAVDLDPVGKFLATPPRGVHLLLIGSGLPNSGNFKKTLTQSATVLALDALKGAELRRWTERELKTAGVSGAEDDVVETILAASSEDPDAATALIEKFALYLDGAPPSVAAVRSLMPGRSHASDFELAEQLLSGKRANTEVLLHKLISQGSSPFMLIGLLAKTFGSLVRIRALLDKGLSANEIKNDLGITPWLMNKYMPLAKRAPIHVLTRHLTALTKADFRLKDRSLGPTAVLGTLAHEISMGDSHER